MAGFIGRLFGRGGASPQSSRTQAPSTAPEALAVGERGSTAGVQGVDGTPPFDVQAFILRIPELAGSAVESASACFGLEADYSSESIGALDAAISRHWEKPPQMIGAVVLSLGSYLGETIRRQLGGEWGQRSGDGLDRVSLLNVMGTSIEVRPFVQMHRRLVNGQVDALAPWFDSIRKRGMAEREGRQAPMDSAQSSNPISDAVFESAIRTVQDCLREAAPGRPFMGRLLTTPLEGEGMMAALAVHGPTSPRDFGLKLLRTEAPKLSAAIIVTDATLTSPEGVPHDAAVIDIYERGRPTGFALAQFYRHNQPPPGATVDGRPKLIGRPPQVIV